MQINTRGRKQIRSAAHWMLAILCVLFVDIVVVLFRLADNPVEGVVLLVLSVWLSTCAARAGYWLTRPLSPENLRLGLLGVRSFFRTVLVSALINGAFAAFSGADVTWIPTLDSDSSSTSVESVGAPPTEESRGMSTALAEQLEGLLVATLSSCRDHTSDRCTEALFRAGSPVGAFKSMPDGFVRVDIGRSCRQANFARIDFEATYRGKGSKGRLAAVFVRSRGGKWALLGLEEAPSRTEPFECDKPPYHDAKEARLALKPLAVDWVVADGVHQLDLSPLRFHSCAIDEVELHLVDGRTFQRADLGCWFEDGFSFDKEDSLITLSSPVPSRASLRVVFTDGSALSWSLSNPAASDDEPSVNESRAQEAAPEPEPEPEAPGPVASWAQAVVAMQPCWELNGGKVYARVYGSADEGLKTARGALAVADCKLGRDRVDSFLAGHSKVLAEIDTKIEIYESAVKLHRAYAKLEFPRTKDREAFKVSVDALQKEFPSLVDQRESAKEVLGKLLREVRFSECRGPVEQLMKEARGIGGAFSAGLPIKNLRAREDARTDVIRAHADLRDLCSVDAEGMLRAAAALVDEAGLVLDHHDQLRSVGNGNWRAPAARISDTATRLQGTTLDVYREIALFVASQALAALELEVD